MVAFEREACAKLCDEFNFGQSRIGLKYDQFAVGISNENLWFGPGRKNSLVMTNNASGFAHAYLQTNQPIKTKIGQFEAKLVLGILQPTNFKHPDDSVMRTIWDGAIAPKIKNDRNLQTLTINWNPKWMPNFYIGYAYASQQYKSDSALIDYNLSPKNNDMSFGSIMFRYVLPKDHVEFYGEFGQPNQAPWPRNFFSDSVKTGFVFESFCRRKPNGSNQPVYRAENREPEYSRCLQYCQCAGRYHRKFAI